MSRVLVTGAHGLVGGNLVQSLAQQGWDVLATGRQVEARAGTTYRSSDLADATQVRSLLDGKGIDAVVHCAARLRGEFAAFVRDNEMATENLVKAAAQAGVKRLIFCSTISVYRGDGPFSEDSPVGSEEPYAQTKAAAERICLEAATPHSVSLRLAGVHGRQRRDGFLHEFFQRAARGLPIEVREPDTRVTPTFVDDIAGAVAAVLHMTVAPAERVFNLATVEAPTYRELAEAVREAMSSSSAIEPTVMSRKRNRTLDTTRIRSTLYFKPLPLSEHLARLAAARMACP
jgi:UDP-glucose 4-epimerase